MNIALLVDGDYLYRFRSVFSHTLVGLVDQPINVTLVCSDPGTLATLPIGPARIVEFKVPFWPWQYRRALDGLVAELRASRVNLIHACSGRSCWLAIELARRLDVPYAITFNGLLQEECYIGRDVRRCGRLIGISQPIVDTLRELYGKKNDRLELIRPGCFLRPRPPREERPQTIVSVGDFNHRGGYETLLRALAEVQSRGLECLAILFGRGPLEHDLHSWANRNKLGNCVSFLDVLANWEDILGEVDFYVQPGAFYALHAGPYEALAHGCPLVTTRDTALDLVVEGKTGRLFDSGDYRGLADILTEWLTDKFDWPEMSRQALAVARTDLSLAASIDKLIACYRAILTEAGVR